MLSVLPVVFHSLGAPLGEPFADDFDYLKRALLQREGSFFDGGGSLLYWRPLGRQVYFGLLGNSILGHPGWVAALHVVALAIAALLIYRALRVCWPGPWAAAAAAAVPLAESSRMLIAWPSHCMDLGAFLCMALALHEAAYRRVWTALAAIVASLLFKEVGVLAALLVLWLPAATPLASRERWAQIITSVATVFAWVVLYLAVIHHAGLLLPHSFADGTGVSPWPLRLAWAFWHGLRAHFSLAVDFAGRDLAVGAAIVALLGAAAWKIGTDGEARERLRATRPWLVWGVAWFVSGLVPLTEVFPAWAPYRSAFAGIGLAVALVALLAPLGSRFVAGLVGLKLVAFALSPGPPERVSATPLESGAAFDFPKLVRLERFVHEIRDVLTRRHPSLPTKSLVGQAHLPLMAEYALSGDKALQVWYRDTTARWIRFEQFQRNPDLPLTTIVEYQPHREAQVALLNPDAVRSLFRGLDHADRSAWSAALAELERADSLQDDRNAAVFIATVGGKRAWIHGVLGDLGSAERIAIEAYALWPENPESRVVLANLRYQEGRLAEAEALLDTLLGVRPADLDARSLRDRIRSMRQTSED